jgi:hypothetical protein
VDKLALIAVLTTPLLLIILIAQQWFSGRAAERKLERVHILVNSKMGIQLRISASLSKRLAKLTGDPEDYASAAEHERVAVDHEYKQAVVDSQHRQLSR